MADPATSGAPITDCPTCGAILKYDGGNMTCPKGHGSFGRPRTVGAESSGASIQDRPPNFRGEDGSLYLVRCFACSPERGRENYALNVASGVCTWCGWTEADRV